MHVTNSKSKRTVKKYLQKEPVVNSYQLARLEEKDTEIFASIKDDKVSAILIKKDETITIRGDGVQMEKLLKENLDEGRIYRFHAVDPISFEISKAVVEVEDDRPTWLLKRTYREPIFPESEIQPLEDKDARIINDYWGLSDTDSTDYIKQRIRKGPAYGIRKNGDLIGWSLTHFITDQTIMFGMLHIKKDWRRMGFAKEITEKLCLDAKDMNLIPAVQIFKDNSPSLSLARDLGFEIRGEHHWYSGKKKEI